MHEVDQTSTALLVGLEGHKCVTIPSIEPLLDARQTLRYATLFLLLMSSFALLVLLALRLISQVNADV